MSQSVPASSPRPRGRLARREAAAEAAAQAADARAARAEAGVAAAAAAAREAERLALTTAVVGREVGDPTALAALDALHRLQATLQGLEQGQARLVANLDGSRRRARAVLALAAAAVLLAAGFWWGSRGQGTPLADLTALVAVAAGGADETDAAFSADSGEASHLQARLDLAFEERNRQLGVATRLREELIAKDLRILELVASIDDLRGRAETPKAAGVLVSRTSERSPAAGHELVSAVNAALEASGQSALEVLEAALDEQGGLVDVLVSRKDAWGTVEAILPLARVVLEAADGVVRLRLVHAAPPGEQDAPVASEVWPLPRFPRGPWEATGIALPTESFVPVETIVAALAPALELAGYRLQSVGGWDGSGLQDVALVELGPQGEALATLQAAQGWIEGDPPRLRLLDGARSFEGKDRPFWRGEVVIPLGSADLRAYRGLVGN